MKNKKLLIGAIIVIVIIIIWLNYKKKNTPAPVAAPAPKAGTTTTSVFPLRLGSSGEEVRIFQTYLRSLDPQALPKYGIDSQFGPETQAESQRLIRKTEIDQTYYEKVVKPAYSVIASLVNSIGLDLTSFGFRKK